MRAADSAISPAPISNTLRPCKSPKIFFARSQAIELTLTVPSASLVSVRIRLATENACVKQRPRSVPTVPAVVAASKASLTWPRICGSPTTSESRLAATRKE